MVPIAVTGAIQMASQFHTYAQQAGQKAASYKNTTAAVMGNKSLVDIAQVAQVEPITIVDADCIHEECMQDLMSALQALFTGYYLQAVNMMSVINGVTVAQRLAPLNPNRRLGFEEMIHATRAQILKKDKRHSFRLSLEASAVPSQAKKGMSKSDMFAATDDKVINTVREESALSIGRLYNVTLREDNISHTIPVQVRLLVNVAPSSSLVNMFSYRDAFDTDMISRFHDVRMGKLEFFKDFILCNDLIDKRRKAAVKDPNGLLQTIQAREGKNILSGFLSGKGSMANATTLAVVSSDTLHQVEQEIGGSFDNSRIRKAVFENSSMMILAVVDKAWKRVRFYHRGLDASSSVSYRELANKAKGDGISVSDILKTYMSGSVPL